MLHIHGDPEEVPLRQRHLDRQPAFRRSPLLRYSTFARGRGSSLSSVELKEKKSEIGERASLTGVPTTDYRSINDSTHRTKATVSRHNKQRRGS